MKKIISIIFMIITTLASGNNSIKTNSFQFEKEILLKKENIKDLPWFKEFNSDIKQEIKTAKVFNNYVLAIIKNENSDEWSEDIYLVNDQTIIAKQNIYYENSEGMGSIYYEINNDIITIKIFPMDENEKVKYKHYKIAKNGFKLIKDLN